mgnify:CR=1 FL=1
MQSKKASLIVARELELVGLPMLESPAPAANSAGPAAVAAAVVAAAAARAVAAAR